MLFIGRVDNMCASPRNTRVHTASAAAAIDRETSPGVVSRYYIRTRYYILYKRRARRALLQHIGEALISLMDDSATFYPPRKSVHRASQPATGSPSHRIKALNPGDSFPQNFNSPRLPVF